MPVTYLSTIHKAMTKNRLSSHLNLKKKTIIRTNKYSIYHLKNNEMVILTIFNNLVQIKKILIPKKSVIL